MGYEQAELINEELEEGGSDSSLEARPSMAEGTVKGRLSPEFYEDSESEAPMDGSSKSYENLEEVKLDECVRQTQ